MFHARQQPDGGARVDDDVVERDHPVADGDGLGVGEHPVPVDLGDLVLLHQEVDTLTMPSETLRLRSKAAPKPKVAVPDMPNVLASWLKTCASSALRSSALGMHLTFRHTPPVLFFDDGSFHAQLSRPDRSHVPTWTSTQDNCLEVFRHAPTLRPSPSVAQESRVLGSSFFPHPAKL